MKRWPLRIVLCLILLTGGAITTVAVAWGLVSGDWTHEGVDSYSATEDSLKWWDEHVPPLWRRPPRGFLQVSYFGFDRVLLTEYSEHDDDYQTRRTLGNGASRFITGWPYRAMSGAFLTDRRTRVTSPESAILFEGFWPIPASRIPLAVEVPGFVIDTLFYAAIWGGVFFGFVGGKRFIRSKRGRCPRCGYDLRGDLAAGCSECGWNREGTEGLRDKGTEGAES